MYKSHGCHFGKLINFLSVYAILLVGRCGVCDVYYVSPQPPSGAGVEVLTANSSPRPHTPHGEVDFSADGDVRELSRQLEKER